MSRDTCPACHAPILPNPLRPGAHELDLGDLLGPEWREIRVRGPWLQLPGWRRAFEAGELRALFWDVQQLARLRHEVARLALELERTAQSAQAAQERAEWYRRQLTLESRAGAMLARILAP